MLVIHPTECIDCGSCEPLCPSEAIISDVDDDTGEWLGLQRENIQRNGHASLKRGETPEDAEDWVDVQDKLATHFDATAAATLKLANALSEPENVRKSR